MKQKLTKGKGYEYLSKNKRSNEKS